MKIITDQKLYRELISGEAPLYVQPAWLDLFSEDWKARIGLDEKGDPVWIWPYQEKARYGIKKYGRLPFCPDNGPVFLNRSDSNLFDPAINRLFSMTSIDDRRKLLDSDRMLHSGWKSEDRFYQYFDLSTYPQDFQAVSRSKRKRMKKNSHFEFVRFDGLDETGDLFLSSFHALGHRNMGPADMERWKGMLDESFDHYIFGIKDTEGNILSAQWLAGHRDTLYGWLAVRHPQFPDAGARELLLWEILQWARDHYGIYDLGGSSIRGVRQFNLEMGAEEVDFYRYSRYHPGWLVKVYGWKRG